MSPSTGFQGRRYRELSFRRESRGQFGSMSAAKRTRFARLRGQAVIEVALLAPWVFFLFAGALDMGIYAYALIATQEAARTAVEYTSKNAATLEDSAGACQYALTQMGAISNVRELSSCG